MPVNFGRNVRWSPRHVLAPRDEAELLAQLARHAGGRLRAVGAGHSWSPLCATDDVTVDLRHLDAVRVERDADGRAWATIGGGCPIRRALRELRRQGGLTLPAVGAITRQTIAGATSTGTHGSGRPSLSHFLAAVRIAGVDADGAAGIATYDAGAPLEAARCALGCLGIVTAVRVPVVPDYDVEGAVEPCDTLDAVLAGEADFPLQAAVLVPWTWTWLAWRRRAVPAGTARSGALARGARRASDLLGTDVALHALLKALLAAGGGPARVRALYRRVMPRLLRAQPPVTDRSAQVLTLHHEYFRHLEMELFVPRRHLPLALAVLRHALTVLGGEADAGAHVAPARAALDAAGQGDALARLAGRYAVHYPLFVRRVLPDATMLSMAADGDEDRYTVSLFHYGRDHDAYLAACALLARTLAHAVGARPHWGKIFPLAPHEVAPLYPRLAEFRALCERADPRGAFRAGHAARLLGFPAAAADA